MAQQVTELSRSIRFKELALAQDRSAEACDDLFSALVMRQSRFVFRVAYSILRNAPDAEDVVQETFLKLYRSDAWKAIENEKAYLARVAWRMAMERMREKRPELADAGAPVRVVDPEQAAIAADWSATVHKLIDSLPENLRQPLALSTIEELKSKDIAAVLGIPEGTVRNRILRARQMLQQKLAELQAGSDVG